MTRATIYIRTDKGAHMAASGSRELANDLRKALDAIDGTSTVEALQSKLKFRDAAWFDRALAALVAKDLIREAESSTGLLDFTSVESSPQTKDHERKAQEQKLAEEKAQREAADRARQAAEAQARKLAEEKAQREAADRARQAAEAQARKLAEEKAQREAADRARQAAEAQARKLAEEKAQREAADRARQEAETQARKLAEEKAQREAADRARQAAEAQAKKLAEEKAQREAADRARQEAEAQARKLAEEKAQREAADRARQAAEAQAKKLAEEKAQREAADRARQEAEAQAKKLAAEKAQREAADRARQEAEAQARKLADEKALREAAERAQQDAEAQVRKLAEEKALWETAERARLDAEAQARKAAEEQSRREAEEPAQREAAEGARQEAEVEARKAAEEQIRREAEEQARVAAEEEARVAAEEQARRAAEEKFRREEEEAAAKRSKKAAAKEGTASSARPRKLGKPLALGIAALLVLGLATIHLISFDGSIPQFEKLLAGQFQQPVKIQALRLSLVPQPYFRLEGVSIGSEGQIKISKVKAIGGLGNLSSDKKVFKSLELDSPVVTEAGLGWILFGKPQAQDAVFGEVRVLNARIESKNVSLPVFDAKLQSDGDGTWKTIVIESTDKNLNVELAPKGESVQIDFKARSFKIPFGSELTLDDLVASGTANGSELAVTEFKGFAQGGILSGKAKLKWGTNWTLAGALNAKQIDTSRLLPGLMGDGRVAGAAAYAMQAPDPAKLFAANRMEGDFLVTRGLLLGVDMGRMLQGGAMSGETRFAEATGMFVHERGATQLRQVRLTEGAMTANGAAEVDANANVRGRFVIDLKMPGEQRRANLAVAGTLQKIEWRRP